MTDIDIFELVKERNPIEDVIGAEFPLEGHGRYRTARQHDSLIIDVHNQAYHWNSRGEHGDVIHWVMNRTGADRKRAVSDLCRRAGLDEPNWDHETAAARAATREREDIFGIGADVFTRWLKKNDTALAYARSRGWNDQVIDEARLGYSGKAVGTELRNEMLKELISHDVDPDCPTAVALLGWNGDVARWANAHSIEANEDWIHHGRIPGIVGQDLLIYPHVTGGRVVYLSGRAITEKRHYNPPIALVGERRVYYNSAWSRKDRDVVLVEGQADAVSLAQLGAAAIALAGVSATKQFTETLPQDQVYYIGLDQDKAGHDATVQLAEALGPLCRLVKWELRTDWSTAEGEAPKDANDLLQSMAAAGAGHEDQAAWINAMLAGAPTYIEHAASEAGLMEGALRDSAQVHTIQLFARMDEMTQAQYRSRIAKLLKVPIRDMTHIQKTIATAADKADNGGEPYFTFGGFIDGYLVEYLYDIATDKASLAWRNPDGLISAGDEVTINGRRYLPEVPNNSIKRGSLLFPNKIGEERGIRELVVLVEMYIKSCCLLPGARVAKLISYYVLLTWVYDMFETVMYLRAMGSPGSGKSEMLRRVGLACYRTMAANGAGSTSSLFRAVERYRCTVFIDEADIQGSDTENDMIKFYNLGAMRGNPIWRTEKVIIDGRETFEEVSFQTFCPKLVAMRKDFRDDAVGSRSLTMKLQPRETIELIRANIPLTINDEMREKAQALRNLLLRWRLKTWQPSMEVNPEYYDLSISARLNQVAGPLLALASEDPEQQEEIRRELREYYAETILSQSMTIAARVIEALWKIYKFPDLHEQMVKTESDGSEIIRIGEITRISNEIMDQMNETSEETDEADEKHRKEQALKPHRVGKILRDDLQLQITNRRRDGFWVYWNGPRMEGLAMRYGVKLDEVGPVEGKEKSIDVEKAIQPTLGGSSDD